MLNEAHQWLSRSSQRLDCMWNVRRRNNKDVAMEQAYSDLLMHSALEAAPNWERLRAIPCDPIGTGHHRVAITTPNPRYVSTSCLFLNVVRKVLVDSILQESSQSSTVRHRYLLKCQTGFCRQRWQFWQFRCPTGDLVFDAGDILDVWLLMLPFDVQDT